MKHSILFFLLTLSIAASAQFRFGAKIAVTQNDLYLTPDPAVISAPIIGIKGGVITNYSFSKLFSLQTELNYSTLSKNYTIQGDNYTNNYGEELTDYINIKTRLHYLEIPLIAKFSLFNNQKVTFDVAGGAFVGYCLSARQQNNNEPFQKTTSDYTTFNAGYTMSLGLSVMKKRLFFEMGGYRGLTNIHATGDTKINTIQFYAAIGYYLFRGEKK